MAVRTGAVGRFCALGVSSLGHRCRADGELRAVGGLAEDVARVVQLRLFELQQRGLADQLRGLVRGDAGQLHRQPVPAFPRDLRFADAAGVDAALDDVFSAVHRLIDAGPGRQLRCIPLQQHVRAAVQIQPQFHRLAAAELDEGSLRVVDEVRQVALGPARPDDEDGKDGKRGDQGEEDQIGAATHEAFPVLA